MVFPEFSGLFLEAAGATQGSRISGPEVAPAAGNRTYTDLPTRPSAVGSQARNAARSAPSPRSRKLTAMYLAHWTFHAMRAAFTTVGSDEGVEARVLPSVQPPGRAMHVWECERSAVLLQRAHELREDHAPRHRCARGFTADT